MRSGTARWISSALAWLALAGAAFFVVNTEHSIDTRRTMLRAFDQRAREAATALADARAAQQAYVAQGQSASIWMSKVASLTSDARSTVDRLRELAESGSARSSLLDASSAIIEFNNIDKRARDYLRTNEALMASDVVFTEGADISATAAAHVQAARVAEHDALDVFEAEQHRLAGMATGGAAGLAALVLLFLAFAPAPGIGAARASQASEREGNLGMAISETQSAAPAGEPDRVTAGPAGGDAILQAAAGLCTELGRMHDPADLDPLVERAAALMDASGLVIWVVDAAGSDLHPIVAHGYSQQVLSLMKAVPRTADNAVAAAYRSGAPRVVGGSAGASSAVVTPLLSPDGCIGALSVEIRNGEATDRAQALLSIFAAQLAGVLTPSGAAARSDARTA